MNKISVIVPCYNVEKYIRECMKSILSQTLQGIEVILIDDGSDDNTVTILEEYKRNNDNVKLFKQKNQGPGPARNRGIIAATGEYIAFMDADDFYPFPDTLKNVYTAAKEREALICGGSIRSYFNGKMKIRENEKLIFLEEGWINKKDFPTASGYWRFIFNSDFIKSNNIFFPKYWRHEDPPFFLKAIACAGQVYCIREATYVYRKGHKQFYYTQEKAIDLAKGIRDCLMICKKEGMTAAYLERLSQVYGKVSACMYLFSEICAEMGDIIHQINEVIREDSNSDTGISLLKEGEELSTYLKNIQKEKERLLEELKGEETILIYGAGVMGKKVSAFLEKSGIAMESFVVSDMADNVNSIDGLQVKCIDEYVNKRENCMVIIATYPAQQKEIKEILLEKGFDKVYTLAPEKFYLFEGKISY